MQQQELKDRAPEAGIRAMLLQVVDVVRLVLFVEPVAVLLQLVGNRTLGRKHQVKLVWCDGLGAS